MKTRNVYLGPVDGVRRQGVGGFVRDLVRRKDRTAIREETEKQMRERVAADDKQRDKSDRINDLLNAPSISMESIAEISSAQNESASEAADPDSDSAGESEGEAGEASP